MTRKRGFTVLELMVVVAIVGILAALAVPVMRSGKKNATVASAASMLKIRLEQAQFVSLAEQQEHVIVIADVPRNDATACGNILSSGCARVFDLRSPNASWKLRTFDVNTPTANVGAVVDEDRLGTNVKFYTDATSVTLPAPFNAYAASFHTFDSELVANCAGSRLCVGYRFLANGTVQVEPPDPSSATSVERSGHAFVLGSDISRTGAPSQQRGILVAAPSGIVRTFDVQ